MIYGSSKITADFSGFSMVEIVIVMVILAVLVGVAGLNFGPSVDHAKLQSAADRLIADLQLVRDQARCRQQPFALLIDPLKLAYMAPGVTSLDHPQDIFVNLGEPPYGISSIMCQSVQMNTIVFDGRGQTAFPATVILHRGSKRAIIKIDEGGIIEQSD